MTGGSGLGMLQGATYDEPDITKHMMVEYVVGHEGKAIKVTGPDGRPLPTRGPSRGPSSPRRVQRTRRFHPYADTSRSESRRSAKERIDATPDNITDDYSSLDEILQSDVDSLEDGEVKP